MNKLFLRIQIKLGVVTSLFVCHKLGYMDGYSIIFVIIL